MHSRTEVGVHAAWRGHYSFKNARAFGDASEYVDEVNCPRFLFVRI